MKDIKKLYKLFKGFRKEQVLLLILITVNILLTAYIPLQIKRLIDNIAKGENWHSVMETGIIILTITILNIGVDLFSNFRWHRLRYKSINFLRLKMFASILKKPINYFQKNSVGEILTKTIDDVSIVAQHGVIGLPMLFSNLFQLIVSLVLLCYLEIRLGIIVFIFIPIYYILFNMINPYLRKSSQMERVAFSNVMKDAQEKILGIRTIKVFKRENFIVNNFKKVLDRHLYYLTKYLFYNICGKGITRLMVSGLPVIILLYGGYLVFNLNISLGTLIAFYTYLGYLYEPVQNLSDYNIGLQKTLGTVERVFGFLDEQDENDMGNLEIKSFEGLEFKHVGFSYDEKKPILSDINFSIKKGDRVLIVGESGSGKSTILNLIMKFYKPCEGEIILNNYNLQEVSKDSLYSKITFLEQNYFLFDGTLQDNITFGKEVEFNKLQRVVSMANLLPLINGDPEGYGRRISEFGSNLSGGEKQRICLARTLINDTELVILDEATSSLDANFENEIVKSLDKYLEGKTLIAISHRPAILSICNKILHLEDGQLKGFYELNNRESYEKAREILSHTA